jgi:hypothetical protein
LTRNIDARANMTATSLGDNMQAKEYGVKKTWDGWRTYANVQDGKYLMPINWANELFKTKQEAKAHIEKLAKEWNWSCR